MDSPAVGGGDLPGAASPFRREFLRAVCQQAGIRGWEFAGWYEQVRGKPFTVLEDSDVKPLLDAAYAKAEDRRLGRDTAQNRQNGAEMPLESTNPPDSTIGAPPSPRREEP